MTVSSAYILSPLRTPIGKFGGALASVTADRLAAHVMTAVLEKSGVAPELVEEVIVAQSYSSSEAPCMGRYAALLAGLPLAVPGFTVDRRCGSGLQALVDAAMQIQTGVADAVLVAGVESMSNIEYYTTGARWGNRLGDMTLYDRLDRGRVRSQPEERFGTISGVAEIIDATAHEYGITRESSDTFAAASHQRAAAAWSDGRFADEVVPVPVPQRKGAPFLFSRDEGIRDTVNVEEMSRLKPLRAGGQVTAGNASQQSDAAAGCLVVSEAFLRQHSLTPAARLVGWAASGCDPLHFGLGPVAAVARLLPRIGLSMDDMNLIEINEAFASQVLSVLREWKLEGDPRVNVNGSGISLGHPIGATGLRIMTTLLSEMKRRSARYGLETMCIGGGQGMAAVFERLDP
jgi:acetyl-CoA C-acetyltransferase